MRWQFESLSDFGQAMKGLPVRLPPSSQKEWTGEYHEESMERAINGDTSKVPEAEALLEKINSSIELKSRQWETGFIGAFPSIPDFVSGHPECMRTLGESSSETTPVRVFVGTSSSAGVDWKNLQSRGVAILAAVMALARSRPVELWTFTSMDGGGSHSSGLSNVMVKVNSNPLRLSEACVALCSIGFDRNLTHNYGRHHNQFEGGWCEQGGSLGGCRLVLEGLATEHDIIVPPSHLNDEKIIKDPLGWVNDTLARFQTEQEEYV